MTHGIAHQGTTEPVTDRASDPTERSALKEWAVLCDGLARGEIVALVRKGGIREQRAGFDVRHDRFLLYPTYFHEKAVELQPRFRERLAAAHGAQPRAGMVRIGLVARVAAVVPVTDLERLRGIEAEHGLAWESVASRFHYRDRPGVQVVVVRAATLPAAIDVPEARRYLGCVSWVALDSALVVTGAQPVVSDADFARRLTAIRAALGASEDDTG